MQSDITIPVTVKRRRFLGIPIPYFLVALLLEIGLPITALFSIKVERA